MARRRCKKGVVKTGPRKGKCRKVRRPLSGAARGGRRRRKTTRRKSSSRTCKLFGLLRLDSGKIQAGCFQRSGRGHSKTKSPRWIPGSIMTKAEYKKLTSQERGRRASTGTTMFGPPAPMGPGMPSDFNPFGP